MRLYFVRHGQSGNNALFDTTGKEDGRSDDPLLTPLGVDQARAVGQYLAKGIDPFDRKSESEGFGITHLYSSLMTRAIHTGTEISRATGVPLVSWKDWHECGGIYLEDKEKQEFLGRPGLTVAEISRKFPYIELEPEIKPDGWWNRSFETHDERAIRARKVLRELLERHGNSADRVVVVSHGGFYMRFVAALIGLEDIKPIWFRMNNTAISRFDFHGEENNLVFHNHVAHLSYELIS